MSLDFLLGNPFNTTATIVSISPFYFWISKIPTAIFLKTQRCGPTLFSGHLTPIDLTGLCSLSSRSSIIDLYQFHGHAVALNYPREKEMLCICQMHITSLSCSHQGSEAHRVQHRSHPVWSIKDTLCEFFGCHHTLFRKDWCALARCTSPPRDPIESGMKAHRIFIHPPPISYMPMTNTHVSYICLIEWFRKVGCLLLYFCNFTTPSCFCIVWDGDFCQKYQNKSDAFPLESNRTQYKNP